MANDFPKNVKLSIDQNRYWEGLGRQQMDFHQVICELIDNSISASGKDSEGDLLPFNLEIILEKKRRYYKNKYCRSRYWNL